MTFAVGIAPCAPIIHLAQTTSTNDELGRRWRARHQTPIAPYTALLTDYQTRGRGRLDRPWMAPAKTSVLASILVPTRAADATWVPLAAGLAVTRVLERTLTPTNPSTRESGVTLKWPNDVLINGEKVAGILAEYLGQDEEGISWVTLGVGINISQSPSELPPQVRATSLSLHTNRNQGLDSSPPLPSATTLLAQVRQELRELLATGESGKAELHSQYESACVSACSAVAVTMPGGQVIRGAGRGINLDGALLVRDDGSSLHTITAADVALVGEGTQQRHPTAHLVGGFR